MTGYIIGLQQQSVLGVRARGLDGPVHNVKPGDYVYIKFLSDILLEPKWEGRLFGNIIHSNQGERTGTVDSSYSRR